MTKKPFFSVITPTYNRADKLYRVYNSLKVQSFQNFEWIIIDDGSTDNTRNIVEQYQLNTQFPIIYIHKQNGGKTSALVQAMPLAQGELIIIADSDDAFVADALQEFYDAWHKLSTQQQEQCNGIIALCTSQHGKPIGADYETEGFYNPIEFAFGGAIECVGENWIASNAQMMKKHFSLSTQDLAIGFIPESYFWNKIIMSEKPLGYRINKRLRIYYINEAEESLSVGIRRRFPQGFYFESRYFINNYKEILTAYPRAYLKHLLKFILFVQYLNIGFFKGMRAISFAGIKCLYIILYPIAKILKKHYFKP